MVKHAQTIRRLLPTNCLSVFDHFVGLALKGLRIQNNYWRLSGDFFNSIPKRRYYWVWKRHSCSGKKKSMLNEDNQTTIKLSSLTWNCSKETKIGYWQYFIIIILLLNLNDKCTNQQIQINAYIALSVLTIWSIEPLIKPHSFS